MDFEGTNSPENQNLHEMYKSLATISKQLQLLQDFVKSKFGNEFTKFCQLSESASTLSHPFTSNEFNSLQDDTEDYDKMPNLVSQESPSRTLGYVTVPLRQTNSSLPTPKLHPAPTATAGSSKRDRNSFSKDNGLSTGNDNEDMMLQLHNFPDLLVENTGEMDTNETPEFLEMELDPTTLLRGEPPPLHPMFADDDDHDVSMHSGNGSSSGTHTKRSASRQGGASFKRLESGVSTKVSRRASFGGHENSSLQKKFDCLICGIKFEYAETLKSHMDSHTGSRNIRSNSEDQSALGSNSSANAPPLPKLMPRPSIPTATSVPVPNSLEIKPQPGARQPSRTKKSSSSSSLSPSSSTPIRSSSMKRRKRYNQSRPCSLECPECGLKIRDRSRLIEHLRGHTGERPYLCSYCDKSYTRKDVLKTHMIKMHGEAPESLESKLY